MKKFISLFAFLCLWFAAGVACQETGATHNVGSSYPTPTGSGLPVIQAGHYDPAALAGDAGQILYWDGGPAWGSGAGVFTAGGDLTGSATSQTVVAVRGQPWASGTVGRGSITYYGASGWTPLPAASSSGQVLQSGGVGADPSWTTSSGFTAGGDLSGTSSSQTVVGIRGQAWVAGTAARGAIPYFGASGWAPLPAGTSGYVLKAQGAGADPVWASGGSAPSGTGAVSVTGGVFDTPGALPIAYGGTHLTSAGGTAFRVMQTGDGSTFSMGQISDSHVSSSAAIAGSKLAAATTSTTGAIELAGDLGGTGTSPTVVALTGAGGTLPIASTGATVQWASGASTPSLTQFHIGGIAGQTMTIAAQSAFGGAGAGGKLALSSGANGGGGAVDGNVELQCGGTAVVTVAPTLVSSTQSVAIGSSPAASGDIRLPVTSAITVNDSGTDRNVVATSSGNLTLGTSGWSQTFLRGSSNIQIITAGSIFTQAPTVNFTDTVGSGAMKMTLSSTGTSQLTYEQATTAQINFTARTVDAACHDLSIISQAPSGSATGTNRNPGNLAFTVSAPTTGGVTGNIAMTGNLVAGYASQAMGDANQTLSDANSAKSVIVTTGTNTAARQLTFNSPASAGELKFVQNACVDYGVTAKFATGTASTIIAPGAAALITSDGANAIQIPLGAFPRNTDGFRLSLTSGVDVTTTDVTAAGTIYAVPSVAGGGQIALYTGSRWELFYSPEISYSVSCTSGQVKDIFFDDNSNVGRLTTSAAWASASTRTDALGTQDGITVLGSDHSKRWIGTFKCSGSNIVEDSVSKRYLWNAYNQVRRALQVVESTASWTSTGTVFRSANGSVANAFSYVTGSASTVLLSEAMLPGTTASTPATGGPGIGIDSTSANSAQVFGGQYVNTAAFQLWARYRGTPSLGFHTISWLEFGSTQITYYGTLASSSGQAGMMGEILA